MTLRVAYTTAALLLCSCGGWQRTGTTSSPDRQAMALQEVRLRGASSSNSTRVIIENGKGGTLIDTGKIVEADGAIVDATRVSWLGPDRLRVSLCEARSYEVRSRLRREPVTREDGSPNEITVDVANLHFSEARRRCI